MRNLVGVAIVKKKIVTAIGIFIIIVAAAAYFGKQKYDSMLKATSEGLTLGKAYGKMINQSNCVFGLQMKYSLCGTMECELSANGYIVGCMETAKIDGFCSNVPNIKNTDDALAWVNKACSDYELGEKKCLKYMHKFVSVCTEQAESRTLSTTEHFESGFKKGLRED